MNIISSLGTFSNIKLVGLCGTYEDSIDLIIKIKVPQLGTLIGKIAPTLSVVSKKKRRIPEQPP
ncbi:19491_t:CDS:2 [Gigaspora rosea]|nr:19491_t:CDS:2 [Gigaspora rosea]